MTDDEKLICAAVNKSPVLQSMLYDLNLLPEQTFGDVQRWAYTITAVEHVRMAEAAEREACAKACENYARRGGLTVHEEHTAKQLADALRSNVRGNADPTARTGV